jgi:hypothetical protein
MPWRRTRHAVHTAGDRPLPLEAYSLLDGFCIAPGEIFGKAKLRLRKKGLVHGLHFSEAEPFAQGLVHKACSGIRRGPESGGIPRGFECLEGQGIGLIGIRRPGALPGRLYDTVSILKRQTGGESCCQRQSELIFLILLSGQQAGS